MLLTDGEPCIVDFNDKTYVVFRKEIAKGSDYMFIECGVASEELMNAYFDELYKKDEE